MIKHYLILISFTCLTQISLGQSTEKTLYFISNSHLDTQWNWDVETTIDQYIPNTLTQNFSLLDKYSAFHFNFEAMIHYRAEPNRRVCIRSSTVQEGKNSSGEWQND